jgi:tetratricopeptide (TPR) repeat protein
VRQRLTLISIFLIFGLVAFHNSFQAPFVFDDVRGVLENDNIRTLWPPLAPFRGTSRPLVQFSLALNFAISGFSVWSYHALNLLIHVTAALTLFATIRLTLKRYGTARLRDATDGLALAIALCWMLHPLQTESVTYVIQRGEAMMGLFCLLMLLCFIVSIGSPRQTRWQLCSLLCCFLGLMTKPVMLMAPVLILMYDRTFITRSFATALRLRWRYYSALLAIMALLPLILNGNKKDWTTTVGSEVTGITPMQYAANQPAIILHYLRLAFWPEALCLDYGLRPEENNWVILGSSLLLGLLLVLTIWALKRRKAAGFAGAWFFLTLAPTSSFVPIADLAFEHRMYLALAGVLAIALPAGYFLLSKMLDHLALFQRSRGLILGCSATLVGTLLAGRTILRNEDYSSEIAIWRSATEVSPRSARAQYNLGTALSRKQRAEEAVDHLTKAVQIRPSYPDAYYNLGNVLYALGRWPEAILSYRRALTLTPDDWQMHNNLGVAMLKSGDQSSAKTEFERTLLLHPECSSAQRNLATLRQTSQEIPTLAGSLP